MNPLGKVLKAARIFHEWSDAVGLRQARSLGGSVTADVSKPRTVDRDSENRPHSAFSRLTALANGRPLFVIGEQAGERATCNCRWLALVALFLGSLSHIPASATSDSELLNIRGSLRIEVFDKDQTNVLQSFVRKADIAITKSGWVINITDAYSYLRTDLVSAAYNGKIAKELLARSGITNETSSHEMATVPDPIGKSVYAFDGIQSYYTTYFAKGFMPAGLANIGISAVGFEVPPVAKDLSGVQVIWAAYILSQDPALIDSEIKMISCRPVTTFHSLHSADVRLQVGSTEDKVDVIRFISDKAWLPNGPVPAPLPFRKGYSLGELSLSDFVLVSGRYVPTRFSFIENALLINKRSGAATLVQTHRASFVADKVVSLTTNVSGLAFIPSLNGVMTTEDRRFAGEGVPIISYISSNGVWLDRDSQVLRQQVEAAKRAAAGFMGGDSRSGVGRTGGAKFAAATRVIFFGVAAAGCVLMLRALRRQKSQES